MNRSNSPKRRTSDNKNNNVHIIPAAKRNFLTQTLDCSPGKLPASPERASEDPGALGSPAGSLRKCPSINLGTPPKKKEKVWKSRWQVERINGLREKGKKRGRTNEATKLLDDEGVIQMLNRVPSVHGVVPKSNSTSTSRASRTVRPVLPAKPKPNKVNKSRAQRTDSTESRKVTKSDLQQTIKLEKTAMKLSPEANISFAEVVSPKRAARNLSRVLSQEMVAENLPALNQDGFAALAELPSEQLELLMNCDIRYSLPSQGHPVHSQPAGKQKSNRIIKSQQVKVSNKKLSEVQRSASPSVHSVAGDPADSVKLPAPPSVEAGLGAGRLDELKHHYHGQAGPGDPASLVPGQYSNIFLRLYESFAQISLACNKSKLRATLNPAVIDEIIHALSYTAELGRMRGVLVTGVGNIFCQGVDLHYLCQDGQDRRARQAAGLAAALERLVTSLTSFPKLLVAAVNGSATGLGVTILPLFDIVYATDKAVFNTFYTRLGQIPEAAASATLPHLCSAQLSEMLLLGRVLTAQQMVEVGLVSQTFLPGRLMEEVIPRMKRACGEAQPGLQWNKLLLKQHQKMQVEQVIRGETEVLTDMWSSKNFHVNLVNFINSEKCLQFQNPN